MVYVHECVRVLFRIAQGYSLECLHALLSYLYTDILDVTPVTAIELYCVADMYCLATLRGLAQAKVLRSLSVPTAAELFGKASEHPACSSIRGSCLKFIVNHFDAVSKSPGFESLTRELMLEIIRSR